MSLSKLTRSSTDCPILGVPEKLHRNTLPAYGDILRDYNLKRKENVNLKWKIARGKLITELLEIWSSASIPTLGERRIITMLDQYYAEYRNMMKPYKQRKEDEKYKSRLLKFKEASKFLFDVAACKCDIGVERGSSCNCRSDDKVPQCEISFLLDQRDPKKRKMFIGSIDSTTSRLINKSSKRKEYVNSLQFIEMPHRTMT